MMLRWVVASVLCVVACSTSEPAQEAGPRSGLPAEQPLTALGPADRATLCDWWGVTLGGPGRMVACSECTGDACTEWDVTVQDRADCVAWLSQVACDATVREAEDCAFSQAPDLCATTDACAALSDCGSL